MRSTGATRDILGIFTAGTSATKSQRLPRYPTIAVASHVKERLGRIRSKSALVKGDLAGVVEVRGEAYGSVIWLCEIATLKTLPKAFQAPRRPSSARVIFAVPQRQSTSYVS